MTKIQRVMLAHMWDKLIESWALEDTTTTTKFDCEILIVIFEMISLSFVPVFSLKIKPKS